MAVLPANAAQGQALFEGTQSFYAHDDAGDNKDPAGNYLHNAKAGSAHEAESLADWARYINSFLLAGETAVIVRNETGSSLAAGPVRITGYSAANSAHKISLADADGAAPAQLFLKISLATATNGIAYTDADLSMDTSAGVVDDPVYLSSTGTMTLTAPTGADQCQQVLGRISVASITGIVACRAEAPGKFGQSWVQTGGIGSNQLAANSVVAGKVAANAITGITIAANTITPDKLDTEYAKWYGAANSAPSGSIAGLYKNTSNGKWYASANGVSWDALT